MSNIKIAAVFMNVCYFNVIRLASGWEHLCFLKYEQNQEPSNKHSFLYTDAVTNLYIIYI